MFDVAARRSLKGPKAQLATIRVSLAAHVVLRAGAAAAAVAIAYEDVPLVSSASLPVPPRGAAPQFASDARYARVLRLLVSAAHEE